VSEFSRLRRVIRHANRQRGQLDQPHAVGIGFQSFGRGLQREPGLAGAARPGERQQVGAGEQLPDFGINFAAQKYVGGMPWMYSVDFMVTVPIFFERKQRPMVAEAAASLGAATRMRESTLSDATARVTQEFASLTTSRRLIELYGESVLPQARLTLESATAAYNVGSVDFLTLLSNFINVLNYEINYEEQQARYHQALARLEPLVGREFIR